MLQTLPFNDQLIGAATLQLVNRIGIPIGIGITTAIWSSWSPGPKESITDFKAHSYTTLQRPYLNVFIATLSFAALAVLIAPWASLGRLGVASTATDPSLPREDTGLKNINLDGPCDWEEDMSEEVAPEAGYSVPCGMRFKIQPRRSSLIGTSSSLNHGGWRRTSTGATSFHLPRIGGSRGSADASVLGLGFGLSEDGKNDKENKNQTKQTNTAAVAGRVIWLVCEDCGATKRIVEPVGDPARYFCDIDEDEAFECRTAAKDNELPAKPSSPTPSIPTPSSKYSSVYQDYETNVSVAEVGNQQDRRRFELVNRPRPGVMGSVAETSEE